MDDPIDSSKNIIIIIMIAMLIVTVSMVTSKETVRVRGNKIQGYSVEYGNTTYWLLEQ